MATLELGEVRRNDLGRKLGETFGDEFHIGQATDIIEIPLSALPYGLSLDTEYGPFEVTPSQNPELHEAPVIVGRILVINGDTYQIQQVFFHTGFGEEATKIATININQHPELQNGIVLSTRRGEDGYTRYVETVLRVRDPLAIPTLPPSVYTTSVKTGTTDTYFQPTLLTP